MVFAPHIRVTALGRLGTPEGDRFSYGFNMAPDGGFISAGDFAHGTAAVWTDLADSVRDFHGRATSRIESPAVLEMVKIAHIGADGHYTTDPIFRVYAQAGGVAATGPILPQSALAVSLTTERRGPTGKGRFFLPMPAVAVDNTDRFRVNVATIEGVRDSAQTLLNDVNNFPGPDPIWDEWEVCVASTKGYNSKVTGVRVGRIVDTMRSRRNKLAESYVATVAVG